MVLISGIIVVGFALCLLGLAIVIVVYPLLAERFLKLFASSAQAHYTEQSLRLLVGMAIVSFSSSMWLSLVFSIFGWVLVVTAVVLLFLPWRWHQRFGKWAIPWAIRHLRLYAVGAFGLGVFILYGASRFAFH